MKHHKKKNKNDTEARFALPYNDVELSQIGNIICIYKLPGDLYTFALPIRVGDVDPILKFGNIDPIKGQY